jgi:hypothetical protein
LAERDISGAGVGSACAPGLDGAGTQFPVVLLAGITTGSRAIACEWSSCVIGNVGSATKTAKLNATYIPVLFIYISPLFPCDLLVRNATELITLVIKDSVTIHHLYLANFLVHTLHAQIKAEVGQVVKKIFGLTRSLKVAAPKG